MQVQTSNALFSSSGVVPQQKRLAATLPANPANSTASSSSAVTISQAARDLAQQQGAIATSGQVCAADPVENYRVPDWMPSLFGKNSPIFDAEAIDSEMKAYWGRLDQLTTDGSLSEADRAQLAAINQPATKAWSAALEASKELYARYHREVDEFKNIFEDAWTQSQREQGVVTHQDYVEKVLHAPDDNLKLRNSVVEKILANPRAVELINTLGWNIPAPV